MKFMFFKVPLLLICKTILGSSSVFFGFGRHNAGVLFLTMKMTYIPIHIFTYTFAYIYTTAIIEKL